MSISDNLKNNNRIVESSRDEIISEFENIKIKFKTNIDDWQENVMDIINSKNTDIEEFKTGILDNLE